MLCPKMYFHCFHNLELITMTLIIGQPPTQANLLKNKSLKGKTGSRVIKIFTYELKIA